MKIAHRRFLLSGLSLAVLCAAGIASADDHHGKGEHGCKTTHIKITKSSNPMPVASQFPPGFITNGVVQPYNYSGADYHFADSFSWTPPKANCKVSGVASYVAKNNVGNGLQDNDSAGFINNGASSIPGMSGPVGTLAKGQTKTISFPMPEAVIRSGQVGFALQDDTAVMKVDIDITVCCPEEGDDDRLGRAERNKSSIIRPPM